MATVDLGITAFLFIAFALLLRTLRNPSWITGALAGFFAMCALLSKTSGALAVPFFAVVIALHLWRTRAWKPLVVPVCAAVVAAVATLYAVTFALAGPEYLRSAFGDTPRPLVPWLQYGRHVDAVRFWYTVGHQHPQFLLGEFSRSGWPHYYFVAFLLKTPIAAQLLFIGALVAARRKRSLALDASLLFVAIFFAVSMKSRIDLGIRYILPIYPFVYTATAIALSSITMDRNRRLAIGVLVAWHGLASLATWPSYLTYFNELIGSHRNADRFLIDSNLDWGQDLHRLRRWTDANGIDFIRIDYFGGGDIAYEFGPRAERWSSLRRPRLLPKGWFALSRHSYRISFDLSESTVDYDTYLAASKAKYVTTVGGSIDVYRVE